VSRAFVKEDDREPEPVPRTVRQHPYLVTPAGFARLKERLARAAAEQNIRLAEELQQKVDEAQVIDPASQIGKAVDFGATVAVEMPDKSLRTYQIVGEDEGDPDHGTISWLSPLAQALWQKRAGARAIWQRPAGNVSVRIVSVEYR